MAEVSFYTHYKRPKEEFEELSDELIVERAGYIDTKTQIENFIRSGQLLMASRRSMYDDVGEDDDNAPMPPDRYINDPIDIDEQQKVNSAYREVKKAAAEKAAAEKAAESKSADTQVSDKVGTAPTDKTENSN